MTPRTSWLASAGLVVAMAAFGLAAVGAVPDGGDAIGIWPVALAIGILLVSARPATWIVLAVVLATAFLTIWSGRPPEVALGMALGITAETWTVWRILTRGVRQRPELYTTGDLVRYIVAAIVGCLVVGVVAVATSLVTGWGTPWLLGLAVAVSSLASQLSITPFFCKFRSHAGVNSWAERAAQWLLILTITPAVFLTGDFPSLAFMVIPALAWGAMRSGAYEAVAQLFVVCGIAIALTTGGHGPFAQVGVRYDLPLDVQGILLATYVADCALLVVPFVLSVGQQAESARQVAAERDTVQNIVNGMTGVAVIGTDQLGQITLFNPGAERLLGYAAAEIEGRSSRVLHSSEAVTEKALELGVADDFAAVAQAMIGTGPSDIGFLRKDGEERRHSMSLNRIVDDRGHVTGYVSTSEDITERVEAENRLLESLDTERRAVERLREVDQVKDAFISSVSHELRTPITSILGYIEMLEDGTFGDLGPEQLDAVQRVAGNSARLLSLIDDLLTLSRVQEGGITFVDRVVDLRQVVTNGSNVVTPSVQRRGQVLDLDLPLEPVPFLGDRDMLERVVINLVSNAVKFTPEGGRILVRLVVEDEMAVVEVTDTGIGIPRQEQEQLFSRFFRSSLAQEQAIPGSGLGLSIARAIVEHHGGRMSVASEVGQGTTFCVHLPVLTPVSA